MSDIESHPERRTPILGDNQGSTAPTVEERRQPPMTRVRQVLPRFGIITFSFENTENIVGDAYVN